MQEAWIPLECVACGEEWESTPAALPKPDAEFDCPYCDARSTVKSFLKTQAGLKILREFHGDRSE